MPSLPADTFGSPAWFENLLVPLPRTIPDHPQLVVEHQTTSPLLHTIVHQQVFSEDKLVSWTPARVVPIADITLKRSIECDFGDILGRLSSSQVFIETSVLLKDNRDTCALGIANARRPGLEKVTASTVDLLLEVLDTPFSDTEIAIRLNPDGTQRLILPAEASSDITIRLSWETLTKWIHTNTGLGHLISNGTIEFDGPMFKLSYIEGHITWPRSPQDHQLSKCFKELMDTYAQLRLSPDYLDLMDQVDEAIPTDTKMERAD